MTRTLRGRVSLLALAAIAVLLAVLVFVFDVILSDQLDGQIDDTVRLRAEAASSTVHVTPAGTVTVRESATDSALDANIWVYDGARIIERPTRERGMLAVTQRLVRDGRTFADGPGGARLYALPIRHDGRRVGTVIAAVSTESSDNARHAALIGAVVAGLLLLAGSYPVLRLTASRALTPVAAMTKEAAEWSAHDPSQRFGSTQRYAELTTLAGTLDELLARITAVMRHERHLAAELSHELRTPISRIAAEADLLIADPELSSRHRPAVASIRATATSMNEIIETLLSSARAELSSAEGVCVLMPLLRELADDTTTVEVVPPDLAAGVDADVVRRILAPIVENARRYAGSSIAITAGRPDGNAVIDVVNDGRPIPDDLLQRIFEPGFTTRSDEHDGTGLGLALSRRLARAADGDVTAIAHPSGACIRVRLPPG